MTYVAGDAYLHLTATGWAASGRNAKERAPDFMAAQHAQVPAHVVGFLDARRETLAAQGVRTFVSSGAGIRRFSEEVRARAWAALRATPDPDGSIRILTGGWLPDLIIRARFPRSDAGRELYRSCWPLTAPTDDDLAESLCAVEAEDAKKANDPLRAKVLAADAASGPLGVVQAVAWVCRSREVADRLRDLGVDSLDGRCPRQYLVSAQSLGLGGQDIGTINRVWWVARVPEDQPEKSE